VTFDDPTLQEHFLGITDEAREKVIGFREQAEEPERQAMWVDITGVEGNDYTYDMYLRPLDEAGPHDAIVHHPGLSIVVPGESFDTVRGATISWSSDLMAGGLRLDGLPTPSPSMASSPQADLTGDVAQRVMQVLERQINPSIAAHGGKADLVAVEDGAAYLRLGGGCQGCGMASVTLNQGIEVAIRDAVPEILKVVDVTDHSSGTNPYFEAAKK
jgi:Fe/S biogenesis protein NfuA